MLKIESNRIGLWALPYQQVIDLSRDRNMLEKSIGLTASRFELNADPSFLEEFNAALIHYVAPKVQQHEMFYEWFTHWLIVDRHYNLTAGGIGATGLPDEAGQVMIGYFIDKKFERRGYATEAVHLFTGWMFRHEKLASVIADTPPDHTGSQKVLLKAGFICEGETEDGLRWCLSRQPARALVAG